MTRVETPYDRFVLEEGIPVLTEIEQVRDLEKAGPLAPWKRKGGLGAYVDEKFGIVNPSRSQIVDGYICEIPPRSELRAEKYLYEEVIYVVGGKGATTVWVEGGKKHTFEWQAGSVFGIPLNAYHQHFNASAAPARFFGVTLAPGMINLFHNTDFVFANPFRFTDRFADEEDFFDPEKGTVFNAMSTGAKVWECNLVSDVRNMELWPWKERGAGGGNRMFQFRGNSLIAHVSEVPQGTYKKAHYHEGQGGLGGFILIPKGEGYTLNWHGSIKWSEASEKQKVDWSGNQLFLYETDWFHQHFNTADDPSRYLAIYPGSSKYPGFGYYQDRARISIDTSRGGRQVSYEDEDPAIMRMFTEDLARHGRKPVDPALWHHALSEEPVYLDGKVDYVSQAKV